VKVLIDQFIQAPLLLAIMIIALSLMKGDGFQGAKVAMGQTFLNALIANCTFLKEEKTRKSRISIFTECLFVLPAFSSHFCVNQGSYGFQLQPSTSHLSSLRFEFYT
jgi:hypothetical protein